MMDQNQHIWLSEEDEKNYNEMVETAEALLKKQDWINGEITRIDKEMKQIDKEKGIEGIQHLEQIQEALDRVQKVADEVGQGIDAWENRCRAVQEEIHQRTENVCANLAKSKEQNRYIKQNLLHLLRDDMDQDQYGWLTEEDEKAYNEAKKQIEEHVKAIVRKKKCFREEVDRIEEEITLLDEKKAKGLEIDQDVERIEKAIEHLKTVADEVYQAYGAFYKRCDEIEAEFDQRSEMIRANIAKSKEQYRDE